MAVMAIDGETLAAAIGIPEVFHALFILGMYR